MRRPPRRSGVVLVLVLLVLLAVVAIALGLGREVRAEVAIGSEAADAVALRALVDSAVARAMAEVRRDVDAGDALFAAWRDDPARFQGMPLGGGRWWLLLAEPDPGDGRVVRWGIRDEASKLNVNLATREQLLALPGITEDAVDGILDWRDADDDPEEFGAESSYYGSLDPPYLAKNAEVEALDELLRIRGIDAAMLYGEDRNRNGLLDPGEDDGDKSFPPDDADGELDYGLVDYLTVFSRELNRTSDGRERLVWEQASVEELEQRLDEAGMAPAPRERLLQLKGGFGGGGRGGGGGGAPVASLGQLIALPEIDEAAARIVFEEIAMVEAEFVPGRINVNTAAPEVLAGLPGLDAEDVAAILERRLDPSADLSSPAWLLQVLEKETLEIVADLVTTRSEQFTVHAVALLDDRPRFRRIEALIDRTFAPVRVLFIRDLTPLGFPFPGERGDDLP